MPIEKKSPLNFVLVKQSKEKRLGYTTGTCAAAAAGAASKMLFCGQEIFFVKFTSPSGYVVFLEIERIVRSTDGRAVKCAVQKDGGSDPDATTGLYIYALVEKTDFPKIEICGGEGVGRVTLKGLDQDVGMPAINSVPRKMITQAIQKELPKCYTGGVRVTISVPGGEEIAKKTFNPKLGIVGGLSILGTSGIVFPMSSEAILQTIKISLNVHWNLKEKIIALVPGNYGRDFLFSTFKIDIEKSVECSNFIFDAVQMIVKQGFTKVLFASHAGKAVKVAYGMKNTHSKFGDNRMDSIFSFAKHHVAPNEQNDFFAKLKSCISTDDAADLLLQSGIANVVWDEIANAIRAQLENWAEQKVEFAVILFTQKCGVLSKTQNADSFAKLFQNQGEK